MRFMGPSDLPNLRRDELIDLVLSTPAVAPAVKACAALPRSPTAPAPSRALIRTLARAPSNTTSSALSATLWNARALARAPPTTAPSALSAA